MEPYNTGNPILLRSDNTRSTELTFELVILEEIPKNETLVRINVLEDGDILFTINHIPEKVLKLAAIIEHKLSKNEPLVLKSSKEMLPDKFEIPMTNENGIRLMEYWRAASKVILDNAVKES